MRRHRRPAASSSSSRSYSSRSSRATSSASAPASSSWNHPGLEFSSLEPLTGLLPSGEELLVIVRKRTERGESIDAQFPGLALTPLTLAAGLGFDLEVGELLRLGADVNAKDANGQTPLFASVRERKLETVRMLLEAKASVDDQDRSGNSPLAITACNGDLEAARLLLRASADPNHRNLTGQTILMYATMYGNFHAARQLILARANCVAVDVRGWTALLYAAYRGEAKTVLLLLQNGADVNHKDSWGKNALDIARKRRFSRLIKILKAWQELPPAVLGILNIWFPRAVAHEIFMYWNNDLSHSNLSSAVLQVSQQGIGKKNKGNSGGCCLS
mmetsp:Transcript_5544/g.13507  ORF Transcript_5544/g.13507 Transcript_5544/m.13507 type:complete len:331 (+) Transcript_5544:29-1021(+)